MTKNPKSRTATKRTPNNDCVFKCGRKVWYSPWCRPCMFKFGLRKKRVGMSFVDRFWSKVNKNGPISEHSPELGPCWIWVGGLSSHGYGWISTKSRTASLAHRISWFLLKGDIPEGFEPDHLCRVRKCVRPEHVELVTHAVNISRGIGPTSKIGRIRGLR